MAVPKKKKSRSWKRHKIILIFKKIKLNVSNKNTLNNHNKIKYFDEIFNF